MANFSKFDGDNNEKLFKLQQSIWWGRGYESALFLFLSSSILKYRFYAESIQLNDQITQILINGYYFEHNLFKPFVELISAYYRFIFGYQYQIPYPKFDIPKTDEDWINHYRRFIREEGEKFSEERKFFPNIIYLIVTQGVPYSSELQKYLLGIIDETYSKIIETNFNKQIHFFDDGELKILKRHKYQFEQYYESEIIEMIKKQQEDNSHFLAI